MALRSIVLFSSIAISCLASLACSDSDGETPSGTGGESGAGGSGSGASGSGGSGAGGSGAGDKCTVSPNASAAAVSFKTDVMPIFGFSCAGTSCHSGTRPKAGLYLGPKCDFAQGKCTYPSVPNTGNPSAGQPLTDEDILNTYNDLMEASVTAPAVKRVVPSDPGASFMIDKVAGIQNDKGLTCTNTESNPDVGPCGQWMPYTGGPLCKTGMTAQTTRVDVLVNWVAQGAKNN
jgi:hypothetical protein